MQSLIKTLVFGLGLACVSANTAQASLVDRGGGMIYDTDFNITWLADANYAMTSGYDADGLMTWSGAMTWAGNLSYGGYTDWRLPTTLQPDATCSGGVGSISTGTNCTGSEMGHLFYTELGGVAGQSITTTHNTNYGLFTNFQTDLAYWSATESSANNATAFYFFFAQGTLYGNSKTGSLHALAVRDGDVAVVPVPAAVWLFGSGLLGLIGVARRKKA